MSMAAPTTSPSGATAPSIPARTGLQPASNVQRECTLFGRVVTNCLAHTGFVLGEALSGGGAAYSFVSLGSTLIGFFSIGAFCAIAGSHCAWYRCRNVRAVGDAAQYADHASGNALNAGRAAEQVAIQGMEMAGRVEAAAGRMFHAAEGVTAAMGSGQAKETEARAAETAASAGSLSATSVRVKTQIDELRTLLAPCGALMKSVSTALTEFRRGLRTSAPHLSQLATLQTKFAAASTQMEGSITGGLAEFKQMLETMTQTTVLALHVMQESNTGLEESLEKKTSELTDAVAKAGEVSLTLTNQQAAREALTARLEVLQGDNAALQASLNAALAQLQAEKESWQGAARGATASIADATGALAGERTEWDATLRVVRECIAGLQALRNASISSRSISRDVDGKTGE